VAVVTLAKGPMPRNFRHTVGERGRRVRSDVRSAWFL
jgi:hypothetical protein